MRIVKVATCSLNQWAMDFDCNMKNIKESISGAKSAGAAIRLGPELEITGYGCEDHFLERDTISHAWECLKELLVGDWTDGILCSFGMPVLRGAERYNCQVLCLNRKIVMIRPKMWVANGGSCSELRWFTAWKQKEPLLDDFLLPTHVSEALSQTTVPFGYGFIQFLDTAVAAEVCMELFSPVPIHPELALNGVEVFMNASGSNHQVRKMDRRLRAITGATHGRGGVYMYSNHLGCDGGRVYYDGCSCIVVNGDVVAHGLQFSLKDVDVVVAQIDLNKVASLRDSNSSFREQASCKTKVPSVFVPYKLCQSFKLHTQFQLQLR
ncbi:UNVERIFIED_CONTAM: Glutamine-dependent NAD(+) synthetase [Sesamum latifolium]|uniref:Glutamine-dependent NAD(+) synthetase n=1 Tax=Sesamum latifolium TaxID=2727402 RepID=A0AAW2WX51_9LAMI